MASKQVEYTSGMMECEWGKSLKPGRMIHSAYNNLQIKNIGSAMLGNLVVCHATALIRWHGLTWFQCVCDKKSHKTHNTFRDCVKKNSLKNSRLLWKWVGGSRSHSEFFLENHHKIALNQLIFWSSVPYGFNF